MKKRKKNWQFYLATLYPLGHIRYAPGTFGSLPGIICGLATGALCNSLTGGRDNYLFFIYVTVVILIFVIFSTYLVAITERHWLAHDDKKIVIDELVGQMVAIAYLPSINLKVVIAAFVLFRGFDILKPWPIGTIDRDWDSPIGTIFDDILAGIMAGLVLFVLLTTGVL